MAGHAVVFSSFFIFSFPPFFFLSSVSCPLAQWKVRCGSERVPSGRTQGWTPPAPLRGHTRWTMPPLPAAPGTLAPSPEQVGLGRKEGPSSHQPLLAHPISFPKTLGTPGAGRAGLASAHGSALRAVRWPESPRLCVGFHVSDFCFIPTFARALREPYCPPPPPWTALHCATLRPGCDLPCQHHRRALWAPPSGQCVILGRLFPFLGKPQRPR